MSERAPYSRIYWSVLSDPKFLGIRNDMKHFGSWTMLLMVADMAWPSPAFIPPVVPKASLAKLVQVGLVDIEEDGMFRIHGLDAERERRRDAARSGPKRDPNGTQTGGKRDPNGSQAEPSTSRVLAETSHARADDPADAYWSLTGKYPTEKTLAWVDDLASKYGGEATIRALVTAHTADRATATLLGRAQDILRAEARQLDRAERADEERRLAEKRATPRVEEPWRAEYRAAIAKQYADMEGAA